MIFHPVISRTTPPWTCCSATLHPNNIGMYDMYANSPTMDAGRDEQVHATCHDNKAVVPVNAEWNCNSIIGIRSPQEESTLSISRDATSNRIKNRVEQWDLEKTSTPGGNRVSVGNFFFFSYHNKRFVGRKGGGGGNSGVYFTVVRIKTTEKCSTEIYIRRTIRFFCITFLPYNMILLVK